MRGFRKRWFAPGFMAAGFISCTPTPQHPPAQAATILAPAAVVVQPNTAGSRPLLPASPATAPKVVSKKISNIEFQGVSFDSRSHSLKTVDQANGPGSEYPSARDCAAKHQALLAINAGFFTPEGKPLGLVISQGRRSGSWNSSSSLGTGIYRIDSSGRASISRRSQLGAVSDSKELLQAGPLLIENQKPIHGLDPGKIAMRSILLHDGEYRWWIGITSPCSLAELGRALSQDSPADWKLSHALNLDGGRSCDFYVSSNISGGGMERKSLMNRQVRNFLILKARP